MTHIVQIAPTIGPGSGVAGVAHALEREFIAAGARVERFTAADAGRPTQKRRAGARPLPPISPGRATSSGSARSARGERADSSPHAPTPSRSRTTTSWPATSTSTTVCCRPPCARAATTSGGWCAIRCTSSPLCATASGIAVAPTGRSSRSRRPRPSCCARPTAACARRSTSSRTASTSSGSGAPDAAERVQARSKLGIDDDRTIALFIGHEFERKGLPVAIAALRAAPDVLLLVVGGSADMIRSAQAQAGGRRR